LYNYRHQAVRFVKVDAHISYECYKRDVCETQTSRLMF
jgi:hypothetical protein